MRALVVVVILSAPALAEPTPAATTKATITIDHKKIEWKAGNKQPVVVHVGGTTHRVAPGNVATFDLALAPTNHAVAFDVQIPGQKSFRRWGALVAGASYRMVGNPCAFWGLDTDARSDKSETFRLDARHIPPSSFPLVLSSAGPEANSPDDQTAILDKPGMSGPIVMYVSAMCPRSGDRITVRSGKKLLLDENLIGHPGRLHTITLRKPTALAKAGFDLVVEP